MNILDIIILVILGYALFTGFRSGMVVQLFTVVGIVVAIWVASAFGDVASSMLGLDSSTSKIWGFLIAFVGALVGIAILSRLVRGLINLVGLGIVDNILGMTLSVAKYLIIMSILFTSFIGFNKSYNFFDQQSMKQSQLFYPIASLSEIFPIWDWISDAGFNDLQKDMKKGVDSITDEVKEKGKEWDVVES